ncbi:hypothetical protein DRP04_15715 [Archaeoglobales archaeon]|nr:MAG: hypothetical protein DRP04_15715 [Archaeoglobales archaeon]
MLVNNEENKVLEIYLVEKDKITLLGKINYGNLSVSAIYLKSPFDVSDPALTVISKNRLAVEAEFEGGEHGLLVVDMDTKESYAIKTSTTKYFIYMDAIGDTGIIAIFTSYTLLFVDLVKGEEIYKITR